MFQFFNSVFKYFSTKVVQKRKLRWANFEILNNFNRALEDEIDHWHTC